MTPNIVQRKKSQVRRGQPKNKLESLLMKTIKSYTPTRVSKNATQPVPTGPPVPKITNVCTTADFGRQLDIGHLVFYCQAHEYKYGYDPKKSLGNAISLQLLSPKATVRIFHTGKLVSVGTQNLEDARKAVDLAAQVVRDSGYSDLVVSDFTVTNISSVTDVRFPINLDGLYETLSAGSSFDVQLERELFPSLDYKPHILTDDGPVNIAVKVFHSGKLIITGAKEYQQIYDTFHDMYPVLKSHKKASKTELIQKYSRKKT